MRILITGGTGFLGRSTAALLLDQGHQVLLLGRDFAAASGLVAQGAQPIAADLRDHAAVVQACKHVDCVIHAGALSAPWGDRRDFFSINVAGTRSVIDGCRLNQVRRLVYVSSPSVVFDGKSHVNATEATPYPRRFASIYSETKKLGEDVVRGARDLESVIIRPKAIFGPGDRSLLPRLLDAARAGRLPQIGDGKNLVDLTFVENVAYALVLALTPTDAVGKTYTITNDEHVPLWPTIRSILKQLHISQPQRHIPLNLALIAAWVMELRASITKREPLLTRYSVAILARTQTYDISAARRDLGYIPPITVAEGMERTLAALTTKQEGA